MNSVDVSRTTLILCLVFSGAAATYGLLGRRDASLPAIPTPPAPGAGAALLAARCGSCHDADEIAEAIADAPDPALELATLEALIGSGHGGATADEARTIVAYLQAHADR